MLLAARRRVFTRNPTVLATGFRRWDATGNRYPPDNSGTPGHTRLYLSGGRAPDVARLFEDTALDARVVDRDGGPAGAASAVKMAYASWTKGSAALVLAARALARAEGVEDDLVAEWALSQPGLEDRSGAAARSAAAKGWRWIGEMEEIAAAMAGAGLPDGFHRAAAEIYRRSRHAPAPTTEAVLGALERETRSRSE